MSRWLGWALFIVGAGLTLFSLHFFAKGFIGLTALLAMVGLLACWSLPRSREVIITDDLKTVLQPPWKSFGQLLIGQISLLWVSWVFFNVLEMQTRTSPRLQPLEMGEIVHHLQSHLLSLGLFPWMLYAVLGIGLAYFSVFAKQKPALPDIIVPNHQEYPRLFIHNFFLNVTETVNYGPIFLLTSLIIIHVCEGFSLLFGLKSLFLTPFRTAFVIALIIFMLRKPSIQLIKFMGEHRVSVGKILIIYSLGFSFLLMWLHFAGTWFVLGQEATDPNTVVKSALAGSFSTVELQTRLSLIIWGWWMVWIPWMTSFVARNSIGLSVKQALINALFLPSCLLSGYYFYPNDLDFLSIQEYSNTPGYFLCISAILLLIMLKIWGKMVSTMDVSRGAMLPMVEWRKRSLKKWMTGALLMLNCYLPAWFLLGWVPAQMLLTLGGGFMTLVVAGFVWKLIDSFLTIPHAIGEKS